MGGEAVLDEGAGFRGGEPAALPLFELVEEQFEVSCASGYVRLAHEGAHALRAYLAGGFRHLGFTGGDELFEGRARVAEQEARQGFPQVFGPGLRQAPCLVPLFRKAVAGHSVQGYFRLSRRALEHLDKA